MHGGKYNYLKSVYINAKNKMIIICPIHGEFEQTPSDHLSGYGCSKCSSSKGEKLLINLFEKNKIPYIHQYRIPDCKYLYRYDFYLPEANILIEFHGIQHYKPIDYFGGKEGYRLIKERDLFKKEFAKLCKIKLIEFNYLDLELSKQTFERKVLKTVIKQNFH